LNDQSLVIRQSPIPATAELRANLQNFYNLVSIINLEGSRGSNHLSESGVDHSGSACRWYPRPHAPRPWGVSHGLQWRLKGIEFGLFRGVELSISGVAFVLI
jgi:hypothetical protein